MKNISKQTGGYFIVLLFMSLIISCEPKEFEKPNIILIMADDLGYGDIGCYGNNEIKTPALDKLATMGLKFTDYHSNGAVCSPTRAALLTGRYQQRSGIEGVIYAKGETRQTGLDIEELTFGDFMKSTGYATGIVGKWHLGYRIDYNPIYQGFDYFRGYVSGNIDYHSHIDGAGFSDWWHDLEKVEEEGYVTDLVTEYALTFIEKNKDKPFFLYVAHEAPHFPYQGRNDIADRTQNGKFPGLGSRTDKAGAYKEMIEVMDEGIGKIVDRLVMLGLSNNTLIIFCSDNGGSNSVADNGNLKGSKGSLWEGGHRVPAIAYWPNSIRPGTSTKETVMSMDLFPTFVNLSKAESLPDFKFDGVDITSLLLDNKPLPERTLFWKYRNQKVARKGKWKLMVDIDDSYLYNLDADISEKINLVDSKIKITSGLKSDLERWELDVSNGVKQRTK